MRRLPLVAFTSLLASCGGDEGPPFAPTTLPPAPVTTTMLEGAFSGLPPSRFQTFDFATPAAGTLTASALWTFAANDVDVYVVGGQTCAAVNAVGQPTGSGCTILCQDVRVGGTTASCTATALPGPARLFVVNLGPTGESGSCTVTLTR